MTMREYDRIAEWYVAVRDVEVGVPDLAAFVRTLPPRASVLDLGCGGGVPVSQILTQEGFDVVAVDSSPEMVARYRANFPSVPVRCERAQEACFTTGSLGAVVAWGMLFHMSVAEQEAVIRKVSDWLSPGGRFLFTSGGVGGESESEMNGVTFEYVSLGVAAYRSVLEESGMRLEYHHTDAWDNYVYVAEKTA